MGLDAATDAVLFTRELLAEMLIESYQPTKGQIGARDFSSSHCHRLPLALRRA